MFFFGWLPAWEQEGLKETWGIVMNMCRDLSGLSSLGRGNSSKYGSLEALPLPASVSGSDAGRLCANLPRKGD